MSNADQIKARALLKTASNAAAQLESTVRELVAMRAWEVLGYENFSEMWKEECGFTVPVMVQAIAVGAMADEGMNTRQGRESKVKGSDGHTQCEIAEAIGLSVVRHGENSLRSPAVQTMLSQIRHGVPYEHVRNETSTGLKARIEKYGNRPYAPLRSRSQPRRLGKTSDELVSTGLLLRRGDVEAIEEIARQARVPKAEIYRQAVAEYLARIRESRKVST